MLCLRASAFIRIPACKNGLGPLCMIYVSCVNVVAFRFVKLCYSRCPQPLGVHACTVNLPNAVSVWSSLWSWAISCHGRFGKLIASNILIASGLMCGSVKSRSDPG